MMKTTTATKSNSSPDKDFKEIKTKYRYTQPRYMNAINASAGFGIASVFPYIIIRMFLGNDFCYEMISYMAAAGAIFLLVWNFIMRPKLLGPNTNLKWKPFTSHYPPMFLGILCWTPIFLYMIRILDAFVMVFEASSSAEGNLVKNTIAKLYLGTLFGAPYGSDAGFAKTVAVGAIVAMFYAVFMYFFCCSEGTPIGEMKRFIPTGLGRNTVSSPKQTNRKPNFNRRNTTQYCDTVHTENIYAKGNKKMTELWERQTSPTQPTSSKTNKNNSQGTATTSTPKSVSNSSHSVEKKHDKGELNITPVFRRRR